MTQEQKDLLLKDLCARLPYGVKVHRLGNHKHSLYKLEVIDAVNYEMSHHIPWCLHKEKQ